MHPDAYTTTAARVLTLILDMGFTPPPQWPTAEAEAGWRDKIAKVMRECLTPSESVSEKINP